jgi:hypothetical protein
MMRFICQTLCICFHPCRYNPVSCRLHPVHCSASSLDLHLCNRGRKVDWTELEEVGRLRHYAREPLLIELDCCTRIQLCHISHSYRTRMNTTRQRVTKIWCVGDSLRAHTLVLVCGLAQSCTRHTHDKLQLNIRHDMPRTCIEMTIVCCRLRMLRRLLPFDLHCSVRKALLQFMHVGSRHIYQRTCMRHNDAYRTSYGTIISW